MVRPNTPLPHMDSTIDTPTYRTVVMCILWGYDFAGASRDEQRYVNVSFNTVIMSYGKD